MAVPLVWTFTQLSGPANTLTLNGWSAPFGRPRSGSILNAGLTVRKTRTDYPGNSLAPTIHSFGTISKPFEIHGRWMDFAIPLVNGAQGLVRAWKDFIGAQVPVRAKWGGILSFIIFIHDIDLEFESQAEVVWRLKAETLVDEQAPVTVIAKQQKLPMDYAASMQALLTKAVPFSAPAYFNLRGMLSQISDQLDLTIGLINTPFAFVFNTCQALSDFTASVTTDLYSIGGALTAMQTGLLGLRNTTDYLLSGAAYLNSPLSLAISQLNSGLFTGSDTTRFAADKQASDRAIANLLALIASFQVDLATATRGQSSTAHQAQAGDTWEAIAAQGLGGIDGARAIRAMNAIKYGQKPLAGRKYHIPRQA